MESSRFFARSITGSLVAAEESLGRKVQDRLDSLAHGQQAILDGLRRLEGGMANVNAALASSSPPALATCGPCPSPPPESVEVQRTMSDGSVTNGGNGGDGLIDIQVFSKGSGGAEPRSLSKDSAEVGAGQGSASGFAGLWLVAPAAGPADGGLAVVANCGTQPAGHAVRFMPSISEDGDGISTMWISEEWTKRLAVRPELRSKPLVVDRSATTKMMRDNGESGSGYLFTSGSVSENQMRPSRFIMRPTSPIRLALDAVTLITLLFDLITIPVALAWDLPSSGSWQILAAAIASIWTLDIMASFRTGYYRENMTLELRPRTIARHYVCRWFMLDFPLVAIDWLNFMLTLSTVEFRWMRFAKINRLLKLVRLFRIATMSRDRRLSNLLSWLENNIAPGFRVVFNIFEIMLSILYVNHVLACMWYWLGRNAPTDTGHRWIDSFVGDSEVLYADTGLWFQYLTSLHWSLTQMTPGSMQVFPTNTAERLFNCMCLLMGFFVFGSMISTLSAETMHLRRMRREQSMKMNDLHNYLIEKNISHEMIMMIKKDLVQRSRFQQPLLEKNVELLQSLSERLRTTLHIETSKPFLVPHPIMRCALTPYPNLMRTVCSGNTIEFLVHAPGDNIFEASMHADFAYRISKGSIKYRSLHTAQDSDDAVQLISAGPWLAEAALWLKWKYLGTAEAAAVCEVLSVNAPELLRMMNEVPTVRRLVRNYAKLYLQYISASSASEAVTLDDVSASSFDRAEFLIGHLPKEIRLPISQRSLATLSDSWSWVLKRKQVQELAHELETGKSTLLFGEDGEVHRLIRLVVLRVVRDDGLILTQVGTWRDGAIDPMCQLPTLALRNEEEPGDAVLRMLNENLGELAPDVHLGAVELQTELPESRKYGLKTKFLKNVQVAYFVPPPDSPFLTPRTRITSSLAARNVRQAQLPDQNQLMMFSDGRTVSVYAWLRAKEVVWYSSPQASCEFHQWLREVQDPEHLAQCAAQAVQTAIAMREPITI